MPCLSSVDVLPSMTLAMEILPLELTSKVEIEAGAVVGRLAG